MLVSAPLPSERSTLQPLVSCCRDAECWLLPCFSVFRSDEVFESDGALLSVTLLQ